MARPCPVCRHAKRDAIDAALLALEPYRGVAKRFGLAPDSVFRHKSGHLVATMARSNKAIVAAAAPSQAAAQAAEVTEIARADRLVDQVVALGRRADSLLDQAMTGGEGDGPEAEGGKSRKPAEIDLKACAALIRESRGCIELQARLLGELQAQRGDLSTDPRWVAFRDAIVVEMGDDAALLERFVAAVRRAGERMRRGGGRAA